MTAPAQPSAGNDTPSTTPIDDGGAGDIAPPPPSCKGAAEEGRIDQSGSSQGATSQKQAEASATGPMSDASATADAGAAAPSAAGKDGALAPNLLASPPAASERPEEVPGGATEDETRAGIWSRQTIQARDKTERLFCDENGNSVFDEKRLDPAGYRLAVGGEIYISPVKAQDKASVTFLEPKGSFFIPPGQFAFLLSEEVVKVPAYAFAFIALRTRTKFKGLVNVSGFHADPGYHGRLIFAVFNAGPGDVHLRRGDDLFTVSFAWLDEKTVKPRSEEERFLHIPSEIITPIAGEIQSLAGLKEGIEEVEDELGDRLQAVERELAILRWALALAASVVVGLLVRVFSAG